MFMVLTKKICIYIYGTDFSIKATSWLKLPISGAIIVLHYVQFIIFTITTRKAPRIEPEKGNEELNL